MMHKSKSAAVRGAARAHAAKPPVVRARKPATLADYWEQGAPTPDERDDEIDCQRIVHGDGSRSPPLYSDDYDDYH